MTAGRVLGYAVATRVGEAVDMVYTGPINDTVDGAQQYATEPGDLVAVCEVPS